MMHRILICSADKIEREVIRVALSDLGAEVRCVTSVAELPALCRERSFDLLLFLETAPFLRGDDPIARIRPKGLRRPAVWLLSWQQNEHFLLGALEAGVDQYMTFPLHLGRLRRKVVACLEE